MTSAKKQINSMLKKSKAWKKKDYSSKDFAESDWQRAQVIMDRKLFRYMDFLLRKAQPEEWRWAPLCSFLQNTVLDVLYKENPPGKELIEKSLTKVGLDVKSYYDWIENFR